MPEDINPPAATVTEKVAHLVTDLHGLLTGARAVVGDQLYLLALESRRAGRAVATMLACGIGAGILLAGFWLACTAALALWVVECGYPASVAMLAASMWDLLGVLLLLAWLNRASRALAFPASVQSLFPDQQADKTSL